MTSNNPFAQRLTRKGSAFSGLKALYASLIIGFIISLLALLEAALSGPSASGFNGPQIVLFIVALSAVIAVPLLITNVAATLAVTYTQSREFPFLLLTNLPAKEIVQGYLYAALYRCRALIGFAISLSIGLSLTLRSGGDQFTLYPATLSYGLAESISRHIIMGVLIAAVTCAIALLGASVGIMLGLWWR
jgi:hypothetical protein